MEIKDTLICPFCDEERFDNIGLKYHLIKYCEKYKNIDVVMENQKDLVEILVELTPLGVIKA